MKKYKNAKKITYQYIQNAAYRYLERYATSEENLKFILRRKVERIVVNHKDSEKIRQDAAQWIEDVVQKAVKIGLVDDLLYATSKMNTFMASGNSISIIKNKLRAKGVQQEVIAAVIEAAKEQEPDINFKNAIKYAKRRRFGPFRVREPEERTSDKEKAAMARAGFSYGEVKKVLEGAREDLEDILYGN